MSLFSLINIDYNMAFSISALVSSRDSHISPFILYIYIYIYIIEHKKLEEWWSTTYQKNPPHSYVNITQKSMEPKSCIGAYVEVATVSWILSILSGYLDMKRTQKKITNNGKSGNIQLNWEKKHNHHTLSYNIDSTQQNFSWSTLTNR